MSARADMDKVTIRLPRVLMRRTKMHAVLTDRNVQDIVAAALERSVPSGRALAMAYRRLQQQLRKAG